MNNITSPDTSDSAIESEIKAKGKTSRRITPADLQANIASAHYFTAAQGVLGYEREVLLKNQDADPMNPEHWGAPDLTHLKLLTFCVLVLQNGFTVTGESACASPENFDPEIGRKIARQNAEQKIWPLMGYALKTELARPVLTAADAAADLAGTPRPAK